MNAKGGMDGEEFKKHVQTNILKLCPDAADVPDKRVVIKVDRGLGRLNSQMLSMLCGQGFHLCSCAPNSTGVTQKADQNCGAFESVHGRNPRKLAED